MKGKSKSKKNVKEMPVPSDHVPKDLQELTHEELSGYENKESSSLATSSTDENEDEGLGDGNMGKSNKHSLGK